VVHGNREIVFRIWEFEVILWMEIATVQYASQFQRGKIVVNYGDFIFVACICVLACCVRK
jgi:hypothetical protein